MVDSRITYGDLSWQVSRDLREEAHDVRQLVLSDLKIL